MEYEIGSLADLITGTVTPNRPKLSRKAFTPVKHKLSPNVTPRGSEALVENDSFLSPSVQKRKNIVKKSPKRIFENSNGDLDSSQTENGGVLVEKTKLNLDTALNASLKSQIKKGKNGSMVDNLRHDSNKMMIQETSTKNEIIINGKNEMKDKVHDGSKIGDENPQRDTVSETKTPKNKNKRKSNGNSTSSENIIEKDDNICISSSTKKYKRDTVLNNSPENCNSNGAEFPSVNTEIKTAKKKKKKKSKPNTDGITSPVENTVENVEKVVDKNEKKKLKSEGRTAKRRARKIAALKKLEEKGIVIPKKKKNNAKSKSLDDGESSSEHESDDELESETELEVKNILNNTDHQDETSDEEDNETKKEKTKGVEEKDEEVTEKDIHGEDKQDELIEENKDHVKQVEKPKEQVLDETEAKRTVFVGNVPYSSKCKKELKKIFSPFGAIDTIRFRTIPKKDERTTPKLAVIKEEFHPDRATVVNAYVKFRDMAHATLALAANNTKMGDFHIRVTRSDVSEVSRDSRAVLFVGNLPFGCEEEQLRSAFDKCGAIESVRIIRDRKTQIGKGFGYVNFESPDGVELALSLSEEELKIKNRALRIRRYLVAGSKKKNQNGTKNRFGPPNNQSGPPNNRFGGANNQHGPPNRFGEPNNRSGPPNNRFGGQNDRQTAQNAEDSGKKPTGAALRIQNKTQRSQGAMKRQRENDAGQSKVHEKRPARETPRDKKPAKDYLGVTAEKKKKKRISKTDKKKKKLSEILVK